MKMLWIMESVSEQLRAGPRYETRHDPINDIAHELATLTSSSAHVRACSDHDETTVRDPWQTGHTRAVGRWYPFPLEMAW